MTASLKQFFSEQLGNPGESLKDDAFPTLCTTTAEGRPQIRYFLTTVNDWGFPAASPLLNPDDQATWTLNQIHIDHIAPSKGTSDIPPPDRDRLGNLTPLWGRDNSSLVQQAFHAEAD